MILKEMLPLPMVGKNYLITSIPMEMGVYKKQAEWSENVGDDGDAKTEAGELMGLADYGIFSMKFP